MIKFVMTAVLAVAISSPILAIDSTKPNEPPNQGHAPNKPDGIGRLDLRVVDQAGNPVEGAQAHLESRRTGGFLCESWAPTTAAGQAVLPPLHVGKLKLTVKAKGYEAVKMELLPDALGEPVRVTLTPKK